MKTITLSIFILAAVFIASTVQADDKYDLTPSQQSASGAASQPDQWKFSSYLTYETGDYGQSHDTHTVYAPFTITRYFTGFETYVTIPYIYQESESNVTTISGKRIKTSRTTTSTQTAEGLGDIIIGGAYYLMNETTDPLNVNLAASIKLPTADDDEGLGTGEFDETIGLETSKNLADKWNGYFNMYYTFIGDPSNQPLDNQFTYSLGAGYKIDPKTEISEFYTESTAITSGVENSRSLATSISHDLDEKTNLVGSLSIGLSDSSPDYGVTGGVNIKF